MRTMTTTRRLLNVEEFLAEYEIPRCEKLEDLQKGDIVACYDDDGALVSLGTVHQVGETTLTDGHEDGEVGEVFVLPYNKARVRVTKKKPLNGLLGTFDLFDCLADCFSVVCFIMFVCFFFLLD